LLRTAKAHRGGAENAEALMWLEDVTGCHVGLLLNFNVTALKTGIHRYVHQAPE
jgi:hypothetical protein